LKKHDHRHADKVCNAGYANARNREKKHQKKKIQHNKIRLKGQNQDEDDKLKMIAENRTSKAEKQKTTINSTTVLTHSIHQCKIEHSLYKYMDG